MVQGEFEATKAWHNVVPENIPEPIGWGECTNRPGIFFLLLEFRDMVDEMPPVQDFVRVVAKAHRDSKSPTEKFGFHVTTFSGDHAFDNRWCDTWEEWFTRSMKAVMERELQVQGPHAELEQLEEQILDKVIPRLIRPMETEGRRIKPCLVHGDLWHGNVGVDNQTDDPVLYDCGSLYAHNECMIIDRPTRPRLPQSLIFLHRGIWHVESCTISDKQTPSARVFIYGEHFRAS